MEAELYAIGAFPTCFQFVNGGDVKVEWRDGRERHDLWAITDGGYCLNREGEWEYEPMPSSRTDDFIERCRFTLDDALCRAAKAIKEVDMKYIGPIAVTARDIAALNDYCREQEVVPYFWGLPGEQIFAFPTHKLDALDMAKLPRGFAGQEWRDTPYVKPRPLDEVIEALPQAEQVVIEGRAADLIAEEVERLEQEEFIETLSDLEREEFIETVSDAEAGGPEAEPTIEEQEE